MGAGGCRHSSINKANSGIVTKCQMLNITDLISSNNLCSVTCDPPIKIIELEVQSAPDIKNMNSYYNKGTFVVLEKTIYLRFSFLSPGVTKILYKQVMLLVSRGLLYKIEKFSTFNECAKVSKSWLYLSCFSSKCLYTIVKGTYRYVVHNVLYLSYGTGRFDYKPWLHFCRLACFLLWLFLEKCSLLFTCIGSDWTARALFSCMYHIKLLWSLNTSLLSNITTYIYFCQLLGETAYRYSVFLLRVIISPKYWVRLTAFTRHFGHSNVCFTEISIT